MSKMKTFKGKIAHQGQDKVYLSGGEQGMGYRISRFQVIPKSPTDSSIEALMLIWKEKQLVLTDQVDFTNDSLIGVAFYNQDSTAANNISDIIIFDHEVVNQDLYITNIEGISSSDMNYFLELEEVKMSSGQQAVVNFSAAMLHTD